MLCWRLLATGCRLSGRFLSFRFPFHLSTAANGHSWMLGTQIGDELLQQLHGDARRVECLYLSQARIHLKNFFFSKKKIYIVFCLIFYVYYIYLINYFFFFLLYIFFVYIIFCGIFFIYFFVYLFKPHSFHAIILLEERPDCTFYLQFLFLSIHSSSLFSFCHFLNKLVWSLLNTIVDGLRSVILFTYVTTSL